MQKALEDGAPLVWPEYKTNVAFDLRQGRSRARPTRPSSGPPRVSRIEIVNNRLVANYMETRGVVAEYDAATERYTLTIGTQGGHGMRDRIAKDILGIPKDKMRVITPDVGGGFGTKSSATRNIRSRRSPPSSSAGRSSGSAIATSTS